MSWSLKWMRQIEEQATGWTDRRRTQRKYWAANRQQMCRQKQTDSRQPDDKGHIDLITALCFPALRSVCSSAGKGCFFLSWCLTHCGRNASEGSSAKTPHISPGWKQWGRRFTVQRLGFPATKTKIRVRQTGRTSTNEEEVMKRRVKGLRPHYRNFLNLKSYLSLG